MLFNNNHGKRLVVHWISLSASYIVTKKHFSESFSESLCSCTLSNNRDSGKGGGSWKIPFHTECEFRHLASKDGKMLMSRRVQVYHQNLFKHERTAVERT
ncbi:hypothetical protein MKW98_014481 [Papaver atlanticum]|uniref:Uncharacterized protein n=1 Tax=Papaver atlanticum TaxID=357466 RepID=A0AAD4SL00_9MAGN|nr:hypothetical protein MKW98_014481 [Papaver atlanticum]